LIADQNDDGYIYIDEILGWIMMKKYHACQSDIVLLEKYSENFELDPAKIKIRRKNKEA